MKQIFAKRLKLARQRAGMSQDNLVAAMNKRVSKNAISKYEKGLMLPNSEVLLALAQALKVKTDFFFRQDRVELPEVKFRKTTKLKKSEEKQLKAQSISYMERYWEIEQLLMRSQTFKNPLAVAGCTSEADARHLALELRKAWNLGLNPVPNVVEMLEHHALKVLVFSASPAFDGLSTWVDDVPLIVLNEEFDAVRKRFTALHELGHLLLPLDRRHITPKEEELFCNIFASELLLPSKKLMENIGRHRRNISINELVELKEYYGISLAAIIYKMQELDILPNQLVKRFWLKRRQDRALLEEQPPRYGNYAGREESERFMQLVYQAAAEEVISLSKAASLANLPLSQFREKFMAL